jgi:hypothetical protein
MQYHLKPNINYVKMVSSRSFALHSLLALASLVTSQKCPLQFDSRIPKGFNVSSFDTTNNFFQSGFVLGQGEIRTASSRTRFSEV